MTRRLVAIAALLVLVAGGALVVFALTSASVTSPPSVASPDDETTPGDSTGAPPGDTEDAETEAGTDAHPEPSPHPSPSPPVPPPAVPESPALSPALSPSIQLAAHRIALVEDDGLGTGPATVIVPGFVTALAPGADKAGHGVVAHVAVLPGDAGAPDLALRFGDAASGTALFSGPVELDGSALLLPLASDRSGYATLELWAVDDDGLESARIRVEVVVAPDFDSQVDADDQDAIAIENSNCIALGLADGTSTYGDLVPALYRIDGIAANGGELLHDGSPVAAGFTTFDPRFCFVPAEDDFSDGDLVDGYEPYATVSYSIFALYDPVWDGAWNLLGAEPDAGDPEYVTRQAVITVAENQAPSFALPVTELELSEDAAPLTIENFATAIDPGSPLEVDQELHFEVVVDDPHSHFGEPYYAGRVAGGDALFADSGLPAVSADGTLTLTLASDAWGTSGFTVTLVDELGKRSAGIHVDLTITAAADGAVENSSQLSYTAFENIKCVAVTLGGTAAGGFETPIVELTSLPETGTLYVEDSSKPFGVGVAAQLGHYLRPVFCFQPVQHNHSVPVGSVYDSFAFRLRTDYELTLDGNGAITDVTFPGGHPNATETSEEQTVLFYITPVFVPF